MEGPLHPELPTGLPEVSLNLHFSPVLRVDLHLASDALAGGMHRKTFASFHKESG